VTSLQAELGREVDMEEVKKILKHHISVLFGMEII
jgi:lipoyl(octanoyl) transferase